MKTIDQTKPERKNARAWRLNLAFQISAQLIQISRILNELVKDDEQPTVDRVPLADTSASPESIPSASEARRILFHRGWSYRRAARELGCHWMHLYKVLKGERRSRRLLAAIAALPARDKV